MEQGELMHDYLKLNDEGQLAAWGLTIHDVRAANPGVFFIEDGIDHSDLGFPLAVQGTVPEIRRWQATRKLPPVFEVDRWVSEIEAYDVPLTLEDKRREVKADADLIARTKRDQVVAGISPAEMASWPIKRTEAMAFQASGSAGDASNLTAEATARGISLPELVAKVMAKSAQLAQLEAAIAGRCGAIQDSAAVAESDAALLSIDLDAGWPV